jgi:hypothetical protein
MAIFTQEHVNVHLYVSMLCIPVFVWKFCYAIFLRELAGHGHGQDIETDAGTST